MLARPPRLLLSVALRHGTALLIWLACAVTLAGGAALYLRAAERAAITQAQDQTAAAAEALEQMLLRVFEAVETLHDLLQSRQVLLGQGNQPGAEALTQHMARLAASGRFAVRQVHVVDLDGWVGWTSTLGAGRVWLGDRPHVLAHLGDESPGVYVGAPVISRLTHEWSLPVTRPIRDAAGQVAGAAIVSLDPVVLSRLIGERHPASGMIFKLRRLSDGQTLARSGDTERYLARPAEPDHPVVRAAQQQPQGSLRFFGPNRGSEQIAAWRVPLGLPIVATAALPTEQALADYRQRRTLVVLGTVLALLLGLLAVGLTMLNRMLRSRLADEAVRDPLTGLYNRRHLAGMLRGALAGIQREGGLAGLLLLDLDHFKSVNETLGHGAGDALLCEVATRLAATLRETDALVRLGGDEFAVLQRAPREAADAAALAARLLAALVQPFQVEGQRVQLGASIGIALAPLDGTSAEALIRNAEMALYRAKGEGRGRHRFFEPAMDAAMQARRSLEMGLRDALAKNELELHYQPLFDLRQWRVTGFEALLRWRRPGHGMVSPAEFIPIAEETGLIAPIGEWVLRRACADAAGWPDRVKVAVNLSPVQFRGGGAVPAVAAALESSGLAPDRLELEITEGVLLQDSEEILASLQALRALGARVALDDFGSGYSSLNYLLRFPFDKVKIDRSFVGDLGEGPGGEGTVIVRAIIGMCRNLGIATTAEGVETEAQLRRLTLEGCCEAQGYLFSRPRPVQDVPDMLATAARQLPPAAA